MRVSDDVLAAINAAPEGPDDDEWYAAVCLDLKDARSEIARLRKVERLFLLCRTYIESDGTPNEDDLNALRMSLEELDDALAAEKGETT